MSEDYKGKIFQLLISLDETNPLVWRRVHVPTTMSLRGLHRLIQGLFRWNSCHLYVYKVLNSEYGDLELDEYGEMGWYNDQSKKLNQIFKSTDNFNYTYDFGDNWCHSIKIEALLEPKKSVKYPFCIGGDQPAPPDDSGGVHGYYRILKIAENKSDPEYEDNADWLRGMSYKDKFDIEEINKYFIQRRKQII